MQNLNFITEFQTSFDEGLLSVFLEDAIVYLDPVTVDFDGYSDLSDLFTRWANFLINIFRDRMISIAKYSR